MVLLLLLLINRYLAIHSRYLQLWCLILSLFFALICLHPCGFLCMIEQPMIYGRGPMPAGMQMVPMVLPDGRIGYVL